MTTDATEFNPDTFNIPWGDSKKALEAGYALVLKKKTPNSGGQPRLIAIKMSVTGSYKALEHPDVERFWYFDSQIQDTLVFALADAAGHVPMFEVNKWATKFGLSLTSIDRIALAALNEYPTKFKIIHLQNGFEVHYKDSLDREVTASGSALEILADIRLDMVAKRQFEEAEFEEIEDLNDALSATMSSSESPFNENNTALVPFVVGMVG